MSTRSKALDRTVDEWLGYIAAGRLRLPSFQRGVAWDRGRVASMLATIIQDLPLGITLVLDVGDAEKFHSRPIESAPATDAKVTEHLLDGQQRLTALWRALKDNDPEVTYFVHVPALDADPTNDDSEISVAWWKRWERGGHAYPRWADSPVECLRRGLIPVRLLDPDSDAVARWVEEATAPLEPGEEITEMAEYKRAHEVARTRREHLKENVIGPLRDTLKHYNLPYLRLPASTTREVALSVFVNMNTNARPLKAYDIVVAELEAQTGHRLHDMVHDLDREHPEIRRYLPVEDAALQTSALLQGRIPNQRGFNELDLPRFVRDWPAMSDGIGRAIAQLEDASIFDAQRIPSIVPLPVVAGLLAGTEAVGDRRATVDRLLRRYYWSSFFTSRYENAAPTRAAADYRALLRVLQGDSTEAEVPIFDRTVYPLPTLTELMRAPWPKAKRTLGRAVLAATNHFGARDFADDTRISRSNVSHREYHHLFPDKLLSDAGIDSYLALNCALITWRTNRTIGRLDPIAYLEARAKRAPDARDIKDRLESQLVPYDAIAAAGPYRDLDGDALRERVEPDFKAFLLARAELVARAARLLCDGTQPQLRDILDGTAQEL